MNPSKLNKVFQLFYLLRHPDPLPLLTVQYFLYIAKEGGVTFRQLEEYFSTSNASASRQSQALENLNLVHRFPDPDDGRRLKLQLTRRGKAIMRQVELL